METLVATFVLDQNKTKEDFSPVTRPWYIRKKRLLKVLKNKAVYRFSLNFTIGKTTDWYLHFAKSLFMIDLQTSTDSLWFVSFLFLPTTDSMNKAFSG